MLDFGPLKIGVDALYETKFWQYYGALGSSKIHLRILQ